MARIDGEIVIGLPVDVAFDYVAARNWPLPLSCPGNRHQGGERHAGRGPLPLAALVPEITIGRYRSDIAEFRKEECTERRSGVPEGEWVQ
jgi:hypothetical protein